MIQNYPFFANLLELRKEQFERNTAHMNLSKEEKDRRWRVFEQQQAAEMAMAMHAMNGQSNFSTFESTWKTDNIISGNAQLLTSEGAQTVVRRSRVAITPTVNITIGNPNLTFASPPTTSAGSGALFVGAFLTQDATGIAGGTTISAISGNTITVSPAPTAARANSTLFVNLNTRPNQIRLPLVSNGSYNFYVDWGDGKIDLITRWDQPEVTHTYAAAGTYNVKIFGSIIGWDFAFSPDANKIIRINKWGCLRFVDPSSNLTSGFFCGCNALDLTQVSDLPFLRNLSSLKNMFATFWGERSVGISPPIINRLNEWDVSNIQDFYGVFQQNQYFNQDIGQWDVSSATNMNCMFASYISAGGTPQKGSFDNGGSDSIGNWDVSNVTNMALMFQFQGNFNRAIGNWNVSNVTNFTRFLRGIDTASGNGIFNRPLNWNTRSAVTMADMLYGQSAFNQDIGAWNVSKVTSFSGFLEMPNITSFPNGSFNNGGQDTLKNWDTSSATNMARMFRRQPQFNQNIGTWAVSKVTTMIQMLANTTTTFGVFNNGGSDSIKNWDVSKVTTFFATFYNQPNFNQPIGDWRPSSCTILDYMFARESTGAGFNQNINGWGPYTGNVISIEGLFYKNSSFNHPLNTWDTSKVTNMQQVFNDADSFDQNIGSWNVSSVVRMDNMFVKTTAGPGGFNNGGSDSIKTWNMTSVRRVTSMFQNRTSFNQPLGDWNIGNIGLAFNWVAPSTGAATSFVQATQRTQAFQNFMAGKTFSDYSTANYNNILIGWASRTPQTNMQISFGTIRYTAAASASKTILLSNRVWSITDGDITV
jgi:surface protein